MQVGKLHDILFDERNGKIQSLVVRPISKETLGNLSRDSSGNVPIPFSAVMSIRDFVVINERVLAIQQLRARPGVGATPE